jgi:hypothetical protein
VDAIIAEVSDIVKQTRNHPSVIIYSGGEEILYTQSDSESDWDLQLITELGRAIAPLHNVHWVPTCPLSWPNVQGMFKPNESIHAHTPHYSPGRVMMEDYYPSLDYAYIPELAISSCPSAESIRKFIPEDELWPPEPSWGYHWADLDIRFTIRDGQLYAIALGWPESGILPVKSLSSVKYNGEIKSIELIGHESELTWEQNNAALEIQLPDNKPCEHAFVFKIN